MLHRHGWRRHYAAAVCTLLVASAAGAQSPFPPGDEAPLTPDADSPPAPVPSAAPDDGDVVERIGPDADQPSPPAPDTAPSPAARLQASGFAKQSFELVYGELAREKKDKSAQLWRDVFVSRTQLLLRSSYVKGRDFEATVSGLLGYTLHVASQVPQYRAGVVDLEQGELDPQLRDAFLGFYWPGFELRIGQQRVAWGRADFQSPNDVINARDLRDPFLTEPELRHIPTPVVRASISGGPITLEGVVSPFFVPDRYDLVGSSWAAIQRRAPTAYQGFLGNTLSLMDPSVERDFAALLRQTARPRDTGNGVSAGARLGANLPGVDLDAYYQYGLDSLPFVSVSSAFGNYLNTTNFSPASGANVAPVLAQIDSGTQPFSSHYIHRHHVGFDMAAASESVTLRLDAAYESERVFYTPDLVSFESPTLLGVASLEYQGGSLDQELLVEIIGAHLLRNPTTPLLIYARDSAAVAATLRWTLTDSLGIDLRGLFGVTPQSVAVLPALRYAANGSFSVKAGVLIISGKSDSFGWYYGDNDSAFIQLRYAF